MQDWTVQQSADLYRLNSWGSPYFGVNALGHLTLKPTNAYTPCDLFEIIQSLVQRGIEPPILLRFNDIIRDRVHLLQAAFDEAILEFNYPEKYQIAFPIKVNPQSHVDRCRYIRFNRFIKRRASFKMISKIVRT